MKNLCILLAAVLIFPAFAGCAAKRAAESPEPPSESQSASSALPESAAEEPEPPPPPDSVFVSQSPANPYAVWEAADLVRGKLEEINNTGEPMPDASMFSSEFNEGNAAYRNGDYDLARIIYTNVLENCPAHSGAINNLALTLMQLGYYEDALYYCILNRVLNPGFYAGWINLQVAGHALGFRPSVLQELLGEEFTDFPSIFSYQYEMESDFPDQTVRDCAIMVAYLYNAVYADMEYEPELDDIAAMDLEMALEAGELTEEEYESQKLELYMDGLESSMNALAESNPEDKDIQLLLEYLTGLRTLRERQQAAGE